MRRASRMLPLALAGALALSACEGRSAEFEDTGTEATADQAPSEETGPDESEDAGEDAEGTEEETVGSESAAAAGIDLNDVPEPLVSATVPAVVEGDPDATLEVRLHSLARDGEVVVGTFSFQVDSDASGEGRESLYGYLGNQSWSPYFIDTVNLTRHDVPRGTSGGSATVDSVYLQFRPGQTVYGYAVFAAPPSDVTEVRLSLVEGAPTAEVELP